MFYLSISTDMVGNIYDVHPPLCNEFVEILLSVSTKIDEIFVQKLNSTISVNRSILSSKQVEKF